MTQGPDRQIYDAIISGAGPVGLFLACELALAKCSVLILERAESPTSTFKQLPFGIRGLSAPTIEAFYRRNLLNDLEVHKQLKDPHKIPISTSGARPPRQVGHFAGIPIHEPNVDASRWTHRLPSSTEPNLISSMDELERVLTRRAEALGVVIKRGHATTQFHQTEDGVTVQAGERTFQGKWLVGCDGSRSVVRKIGGFEFAGTEPEFTGYSTQVDIVDPEKLKPGRNLTATGMYLQSQPGYIMLQDFDGGAFHGEEKPASREHVQAVLRRISNTDVSISALHFAATWTDRSRQATAYRKGRVLLAGDAAHIHSPLGGQGVNLGLGDAMNLGWKLAQTIQDKAPEGLLDSYYEERHGLGEKILDWSRAQVSIMKPGPHARAMNAIIRDLMNTRDGATYFAGRVWGISTHYDLGGGHPLVGHSVPNFEFDDGTKIGEVLQAGLGIVLDIGGSPAIKAFVDQYSGRLLYVSKHAKDAMGLGALLIRPDGYIAWVAEGEGNRDELRKAASRWLV